MCDLCNDSMHPGALFEVVLKELNPEAPFLPEEVAIYQLLQRAWSPIKQRIFTDLELILDFDEQSYLGGIITKMQFQEGWYRREIPRQWNSVKDEVRKYLALAYARQHTSVRKFDDVDLDMATSAILYHLGLYFQEHLMAEVAPKIVEHVYSAKTGIETTPAVINKLTKTIESEAKFVGVASIGASRAYQFGFIDWASRAGITTYMIDGYAGMCKICAGIVGSTFQVSHAVEYKERFLEISNNPELIKQEFPFPSVRDVRDSSQEHLQQSPYILPPYHPHCRCYVATIGVE